MKRMLKDRFCKNVLLFALNFPSLTFLILTISLTWIIAIPIVGPTLCDCGWTYHQNITAATIISFFIILFIAILNIENSPFDTDDYLNRADKLLKEIENEKSK